jgi:hypothetical protein
MEHGVVYFEEHCFQGEVLFTMTYLSLDNHTYIFKWNTPKDAEMIVQSLDELQILQEEQVLIMEAMRSFGLA